MNAVCSFCIASAAGAAEKRYGVSEGTGWQSGRNATKLSIISLVGNDTRRDTREEGGRGVARAGVGGEEPRDATLVGWQQFKYHLIYSGPNRLAGHNTYKRLYTDSPRNEATNILTLFIRTTRKEGPSAATRNEKLSGDSSLGIKTSRGSAFEIVVFKVTYVYIT